MEVALSPFGIAGHGSWLVSCCERTVVKCINIGDVEDYAPPPGPAPLGRLGNEVKIAPPYSKAGEGRLFVAIQDLKPQRAVESDSSWHFVGAQCDRADPLDHGQSSPVLFPRAVSTGQSKAECATYRLTAASWIDWIRNVAMAEAGSWDTLRERLKGRGLRPFSSYSLCSEGQSPLPGTFRFCRRTRAIPGPSS